MPTSTTSPSSAFGTLSLLLMVLISLWHSSCAYPLPKESESQEDKGIIDSARLLQRLQHHRFHSPNNSLNGTLDPSSSSLTGVHSATPTTTQSPDHHHRIISPPDSPSFSRTQHLNDNNYQLLRRIRLPVKASNPRIVSSSTDNESSSTDTIWILIGWLAVAVYIFFCLCSWCFSCCRTENQSQHNQTSTATLIYSYVPQGDPRSNNDAMWSVDPNGVIRRIYTV